MAVDSKIFTREYAEEQDKQDPLRHLREEFQIPSKADLKATSLKDECTSAKSPLLPTEHILSIIDAHADSAALLLLPGIQFYTGQYFDMPRITAHAQAKGLVVGWDLAHAVGNVPVQLHAWNVDFAAWCTYKYLNCGPGAIGGLFVHERHAPAAQGTVSPSAPKVEEEVTISNGNGAASSDYRPRLTGWWGSSKASRFAMTNSFEPIPGAGGFQVSNPSALDLSAVAASLSVFEQTSIAALRQKSLKLTKYLEDLLLHTEGDKPYTILTSQDPEARGAQLSVLLQPGLLDTVMEVLEEEGVVLDERKPDVIRVAPAPLYNNHHDLWRFNECFRKALTKAVQVKADKDGK
ncbi:hypothetical protein FH972_021749 [Carpinus fangiana]|uniref:Aminotransferase class V domain-containing protein n=1 Tax=Carpinus fangiana TaxID=176857 RepID=A0A5N6KQS6_9ROSI|nr:hypothetical protein FH972_021749 [Carpinus fangiana]